MNRALLLSRFSRFSAIASRSNQFPRVPFQARALSTPSSPAHPPPPPLSNATPISSAPSAQPLPIDSTFSSTDVNSALSDGALHVASSAPQVPSAVTDMASTTTTAEAAAEAAATVADSSTFSDTLLQPAMTLLSTAHDVTNLPWYLTIAASTIAIRFCLLPVTLFTMRNSARMQAIQPELGQKREAIMEAIRSGNKPLANERQAELQAFVRGAGVSPSRVLAGPLVQFPVFISFFISLRRMSLSEPTFVTGGTSWFTDLSVMDPTYALPIICGASLLAMTEFGGDTGSTKMSPGMRMGMRAVAFLSVPLTYWFPSAVFCYWIPNNLFSVSLGATVKMTPIRKLLGLNITPADVPGTKASKKRLTDMAILARKAGIEKNVDIRGTVNATEPVLLKQRPRRKKAQVS